MKKTALYLVIITVFSNILGFLRDIVLSYFYGTSGVSDAYLISLTIPGIIFTFIGVGLSTIFIPVYSSALNEKDQISADKFMNNTINFLLIACSVIVVIGLVFAEESVKLFASGFKGDTLKLAVSFTKISIFGIYFSGLIYILSGYLQIKNKFIITATMGLPFNIVGILFIYLGHKYNIMFLSVGSIASVAIQFLCLLYFAKKQGFKYETSLNKNDEYFKKMLNLSIPVILGVSVNQINSLVDQMIASNLGSGGISALNYANKINLSINTIFVMSVVTILYPKISKLAAEKKVEELKKSATETINIVIILIIPITMGVLVFSNQIITLLFGRGAFDSFAINMTSKVLIYFSIGLIGIGLREVLSRVFYSMQDTKTPMINAAIGLGLNIILNIILSKYLGIGGLALATSISAIFTSILLFINLTKKIGDFAYKEMLSVFSKTFVSSVIMSLGSQLIFTFVSSKINLNIYLFISIFFAIVIYSVLIYIMRIDIVIKFTKNWKLKLKMRKV
ncbi:Lipid II flippase MurJ [Paenibacillus auburnensis]|uniref:Probable lipid II flippase MurJ n=1 Tax=Paenibacillus auburnensis TaxID=2905649 RepID=A0ABM9CWZ0_9BACL|nr:murein biosynthesis integral membrane protein MurJ [Paenibacillus auburnensis]CAH1225195.1 Lipid II flippase MurJ [Paenibacillus auburnensis]